MAENSIADAPQHVAAAVVALHWIATIKTLENSSTVVCHRSLWEPFLALDSKIPEKKTLCLMHSMKSTIS
jgi:hypothetical protein